MAEHNFASSTVWVGDNLRVMRGINSECIDLIYLDPPFNSNRSYEAPIGSKAAGAAFKDAWTLDDVDVHEHGELADRSPAAHSVIEAARHAHGKSMQAYLIMMAVRLMEMHRILKPTGSIYLHCDTTASHYLKAMLDGLFGSSNFQNEFVWYYSGGGASKTRWARKHDVILFYSVGNKWTFNADSVRVPYKWDKGQKRADGTSRDYKKGKLADDVWQHNSLMPWSKERTGYPTQKPLALLERIISASSNKGDVVLDPFCGCATALVAADRLQRKWAGIDLSKLAVDLVNERISQDRGGDIFAGAIEPDAFPSRTDLGSVPDYRTHKHRLYGEQEGICVGCRMHFPFKTFEVDHILPKSKGGTDHSDNLQLLCNHCNRSKGNKTMSEWNAAKATKTI